MSKCCGPLPQSPRDSSPGAAGPGDRQVFKRPGIRVWLLRLLLLVGTAPLLAAAPPLDSYQDARESMVTWQLKRRGITDPRVLVAMAKVPRHRFVPGSLASLAYGDHPLPIGEDQTISQPYIVALMTEWAEVKPGDKVLEIGTGSGYQAAVLAELTDRVFTIEIRPKLAKQAAALLKNLGYNQVKVKCGDGYLGWPEEAPFDAILVTAAAPRMPQALKDQLKEGGHLIIPLGEPWRAQNMSRFRKVQGELKEGLSIPVRFVPLVRPEVLEPSP